MNDSACYRVDMGTSARDSMDADTPDGACITCGWKSGTFTCEDCGKCRVCDCRCEIVTLVERDNQSMALEVTALRAELVVMHEERDACLVELDTMGNKRMRMQGEIATLRERNSALSLDLFMLRTERMRAEIATLHALREVTGTRAGFITLTNPLSQDATRMPRIAITAIAHYVLLPMEKCTAVTLTTTEDGTSEWWKVSETPEEIDALIAAALAANTEPT